MHFIDPNQEHIKLALEIHVRELRPILEDRINKCNIDYLRVFFRNNIESLLRSKPKQLIQIQNNLFDENPDFRIYLKEKRKTVHFNTAIRDKYSIFHKEIQKVINYKDFVTKSNRIDVYDAYDLAENLNINTCTYCNRLYTKTIIKQRKKGKLSKLTRPTFDHWFSQSKNPILALSFYNLIPSCNVCNSSLKSSTEMTLEKYLHPYVDEKINFQFSYKLKSINKYDFIITNIGDDENSKSKNTSDFFKLKVIYESHIDEVEDLLKLKKAYTATYLKSIKAFFKNASALSNEEIYRLAFGTEINESKFEKRPLSRMKRDILVELGIIKK